MAGAFQIARDIFDNSIWQNITEFRLFFLIVGNAIFSEDGKEIAGILLKRGQWLRSYRNLQSDLEYLENHTVKQPGIATIKRAIDSLVHDERITAEVTEHGTLFTVLNYAKYQGLENYKTSNVEQMRNTDGTLMEQMRNNNKKDKKVKKDNIYTPDFDSWYSSWPRPQAKQDSFKSFEKRKKEHGLEFILRCSQNYLCYLKSLPPDKQEYAYASNNFFGQKAYYLEYEKPKQAPVTKPNPNASPKVQLISIDFEGGD